MDSAWWMLLSAASKIFLKGSWRLFWSGLVGRVVWRCSWNTGGERGLLEGRGENSTWFCTL